MTMVNNLFWTKTRCVNAGGSSFSKKKNAEKPGKNSYFEEENIKIF